MVSTHSLKLPFLEDAKKLHLKVRSDGAYFVQENSPLVSELKFPRFLPDRPGKGPLFMAKKLTFNEVLREGSTVHLDKRLLSPRAVVVNSIGSKFLSSTAFTSDQHSSITLTDLGDHLEDLPHFIAIADDIGNSVFFRELVP